MTDNTELSNRIVRLQKERDYFLGRMYEVMAIISAGTFAVLVSMNRNEHSLFSQGALLFFVMCMVSCVLALYCKAKKSGIMMLKVLENPHIVHQMKPSCLSRFADMAAWSCFLGAYILLLVNTIV